MSYEMPFTFQENIDQTKKYCASLTQYKRRLSRVVQIGDTPLGGLHPIRVQSMTTVDTMDTQGSVAQAIRMIESGCDYVRITAPSMKEAQNLENIKKELRIRGYHTPLVADIHFTPNAAEVAARIVEKVRINPGNYADKKKFATLEYTDDAYEQELERIRAAFSPLVSICKEYGTAMRIGTNHGSLSDRIMSRYGDTPLGMVESALEFIRICEDLDYYNLVISMKSSNTQVMVQAYRLLVNKLETGGHLPYPLHLGVTEAGEAEDGRIKSAIGIGTLLEDGLGDTVRVSLTEDPEFEMPVGKKLVSRYVHREEHKPIQAITTQPVDPYEYNCRKTQEVRNFGGHNVPRVIADLSAIPSISYADLKSVGLHYFELTDKWNMTDVGADYIYSGRNEIQFMLPNGTREILDHEAWAKSKEQKNKFPLFPDSLHYFKTGTKSAELNFVRVTYKDLNEEFYATIKADPSVVLLFDTQNTHAMPALRRLFFYVMEQSLECPVVILRKYEDLEEENFLLHAATDVGGLLIDGLGDGIMLSTELLSTKDDKEWQAKTKLYNDTSFAILQAARTRMTKTEYISCPSCGRTLFDLQETTAMIRQRTDHLKGVKIGIMGCIVNGPGEMADADFGYVGVGKDKIALYKGKDVVKRSVPAEKALDELIELIKEHGSWIEPNSGIK
jgi:(E)-4-hydroxy-3-methylbut-2-enyl-diphosphate synthase